MGKNTDIEIELKYPVQFAEELVSKITLRRPKGKDLKGLRDLQNSHDDQLKLMARLMGQPTAFVDEMDFVDLTNAMEKTMDFLPDGQPTTKKP